MGKQKKLTGGMLCLSVCFIFIVMMLVVPGRMIAGQPDSPAGRILFEDKQARVKIIKTPAGVILKITIDKQGRITVKEIDHYPAR